MRRPACPDRRSPHPGSHVHRRHSPESHPRAGPASNARSRRAPTSRAAARLICCVSIVLPPLMKITRLAPCRSGGNNSIVWDNVTREGGCDDRPGAACLAPAIYLGNRRDADPADGRAVHHAHDRRHLPGDRHPRRAGGLELQRPDHRGHGTRVSCSSRSAPIPPRSTASRASNPSRSPASAC